MLWAMMRSYYLHSIKTIKSAQIPANLRQWTKKLHLEPQQLQLVMIPSLGHWCPEEGIMTDMLVKIPYAGY